MKNLCLILMLFILPVCALAQGAQYTGVAQTARNMIGMGNVYVPIPGASVNVCTGVYTGTACPSGGNVTVYSNQALTTSLTQPLTADNYGNFTFWAAPGAYYFTVTGQGAASSSYQITLPFGISGTYNATAKSIEQARYADQYGASGSAQSTTGTIIATGKTLTLAAAIDFVNGQGIAVPHAGAATSVVAPASPSATATCPSACTTTYSYEIAALDASGGESAVTAAVTASNNATLSKGTSGSLATTRFYNQVSWTAASGAKAYVIYCNMNGGAYGLCGFSQNTTFYDFGERYMQSESFPTVSATPPASALADTLISTISSGAGTITLTLADAATTAVSNGAVYHDDRAAIASALADGNKIMLPPGTYNIFGAGISPAANQVIEGYGPTSILAFYGGGDGILLQNAYLARIQNLEIQVDSPALQDWAKIDSESSTYTRNTLSGITVSSLVNTYGQRGLWLTVGNGNYANYQNVIHDIRTGRVDVPWFFDSPYGGPANGNQAPNLNTITDVQSVYESTCFYMRDAGENSIAGAVCLGGESVPQAVGVQLGDSRSTVGALYNRFFGLQCDQTSGTGDGVCYDIAAPATGNVSNTYNYVDLHDADATAGIDNSGLLTNTVMNERWLQNLTNVSTGAAYVNSGEIPTSGPVAKLLVTGASQIKAGDVTLDNTHSVVFQNPSNPGYGSSLYQDSSGNTYLDGRGSGGIALRQYSGGTGFLPMLSCYNNGSANCGIGYAPSGLPGYNFSVNGTSYFTGSVTLNGGGSIASGKTFTNNGTISGGMVNATTLQQGGAAVALASQLPLSGSVAGSTTSLAANTCGDVVTQTVTGATTTMTPVVTVSGALPTSGLVIQAAVTATNTVSIEYCNVTTGSVIPAAATLEIRVVP